MSIESQAAGDATPKYVISVAKRSVIDVMDVKGAETVYGRERLEDILRRDPSAEVLPEEQAFARVEGLFISGPKAISEQRFVEMLECLPPMDWDHSRERECFKMSEFLYGNVTSIFVRIGEYYYELADYGSLKASEIFEKVRPVHEAIETSSSGSGKLGK